MPVPLTIVVLVAAQDVGEPALASFAQATRHALGADTHVLVAEADAKQDDPRELERAYHADAIVALSWGGARHEAVQVRVHRTVDEGWVVREIRFGKQDRAAEQGRTLGFTVAAMFPERMAEALAPRESRPREDTTSPRGPETPAPVPASPPRPPSRPATTEGSPPVSEAERALTERREIAPTIEPREATEPREWSNPHGSIAALALFAPDLGGAGGGVGGMVRAELFLHRYWSLRAVVSARAANVSIAKASSTMITTGLGVSLRLVRPTRRMPLELSVGADALLMRQSLSHFDGDDSLEVNQSRFVPAAEALVTGTWMLTPALGIFLDIGGEAAFGTTRIFLHGAEVSSIAPVHALAGVGAVGHF